MYLELKIVSIIINYASGGQNKVSGFHINQSWMSFDMKYPLRALVEIFSLAYGESAVNAC